MAARSRSEGEDASRRVAARPMVSSRPKMDLCPVTETAKIIGKKWYLIILHELTRQPMGFNELKRAVRGISAKVLSENLTELELRGLLTRTVYSDSPVRVEYALTDKGRELDGIFLSMRVWGEKWAICIEDEAAVAAPPVLRS